LAALGPENACAAAATRPKFIDGAAEWLLAVVDDAELFAGTELLARWRPAARARDVVGFARASCAADMAAVAGTAGMDDGGSALPAPPTRARRSGLDTKYLREHRSESAMMVTSVDFVLTRQGGRKTHLFRVWGGWRTASTDETICGSPKRRQTLGGQNEYVLVIRMKMIATLHKSD